MPTSRTHPSRAMIAAFPVQRGWSTPESERRVCWRDNPGPRATLDRDPGQNAGAPVPQTGRLPAIGTSAGHATSRAPFGPQSITYTATLVGGPFGIGLAGNSTP